MKNRFKFIIIFFVLFNSIPLYAAGEETLNNVMGLMLIITVGLILFVLWLALSYSEKDDVTGDLFLKPLRLFKKFITRSTPIEKEHEILMSHNYDGIRELDNKIPPWFTFLFYGTILFGIIYMIHYHVIGSGDVQANEYREEMQMAEVQRNILIKSGAFLNEETVTLATDAAALSSGKEIFNSSCATCHGMNGEGLVGPNLTDKYWIHGGGIKNVFKVIKYGVPQKGMISWQSQLSPTKMQEVASYILSLQGTEPPNAKPPEGEVWEEPSEKDTQI